MNIDHVQVKLSILIQLFTSVDEYIVRPLLSEVFLPNHSPSVHEMKEK